MICPSCATENPPGKKFCIECGTPLALSCESCGAALVGNEKFCGECGAPASAQVGPFYCPADQEIYFDLGFLDQLQQQFGAQGDFAQSYILAHEFGHHLQTLLGAEQKVRAAEQRDPGHQNQYSIRLELQADCYAGVWSNLAAARGRSGAANGVLLQPDNIAEAVNAAQAVGDDRIQKMTQGQIHPETFTHGSSRQRVEWFQKGFTSGDLNACDTFRPSRL